MALFTRSSCDDSIDRFNHTWLVIFLLVLAAVTFFIPFGLPPSGRMAPGGEAGRPEALPKYRSFCWCPTLFTGSMVEYTNAACTAAFAHAHSTSTSIENKNTATLYRMSIEISEKYVPERVAETNGSETNIVEYIYVDAHDFVLEYTPLFLFVTAVIFKFTHALFVLFLNWYGVNLGSLAATWRSLLADAERGDQPKQTFLNDVSRKLKTSRWISFGYLAYKLTVCILCLIVEVFIYYIMLSGLFSLNEHLLSSDHSGVVQSRSESVKLLCELPVMEKQNIHTYAVQCIFTATPSSATDHSDDYSRMVNFYKPFYTALLFTFVIITLVNALNWTLWAVKLCCSKSSKQPDNSLSLDARLLVCLTAENVDCTGSEQLEEGLTRAQKGSDVNDFSKETEDL